MAWVGSFSSCWLRMQAHMTNDDKAQFAIIRFTGEKQYQLIYINDLPALITNPEDLQFRIVACPKPSELRAMIKTGQFNLFEQDLNASPA